MTTLKGDIVNRVRRLPKPSKASEALQPVFEAISNALHAVEDKFGPDVVERGRVLIDVKHLSDASRLKIAVIDNGIGLDTARFEAFCETDTNFKFSRGGKGIGRLLWLDAFDDIRVASRFDESGLQERKFRFQLQKRDQIADERMDPIEHGETGTTVSFNGLRTDAYRQKFPKQTRTFVRHFGSHFFVDFMLSRAPSVDVTIDGVTTQFPQAVLDMLSADRGEMSIETEEFGALKLTSFICTKDASADFEGKHQLHLIANGRTVTTRKIDGLLSIGQLGETDLTYHGCLSGPFLDERVNQERTSFTFDESAAVRLSRICADELMKSVLAEEVREFHDKRVASMEMFLGDYPTFQFEGAEDLLKRVPKAAIDAEQFAQALIPTRIRRDEARRKNVQAIVATLASEVVVPDDFAQAVRKAAEEVQAEEQRQLTEYVLRRKMVLDVMDVLIRRVREVAGKDEAFHLEGTLHQFICPMRVRGDDPDKIEATDHDLWILDERLAFARYFASDVSFASMIEAAHSRERPDLLIFDRLHGLGLGDDEPLKRVILVEFKQPGRTKYDERYSPNNQINRYLAELKGNRVESFANERIRIAEDCVFYCYIVADIVGELDIQTRDWRTTANGRGKWRELSGDYRGAVEIIEWRDLVKDARSRNAAFIRAAGLPAKG